MNQKRVSTGKKKRYGHVEQVTVGSYSIRFRVFNIFSASAGLLWIGAAVALVF